MKFLCGDRKSIYIWFSGFFAFVALVHLVRTVFGMDVVVNGWSVPVWVSAVLFVFFSIVSITCCLKAGKYGPTK